MTRGFSVLMTSMGKVAILKLFLYRSRLAFVRRKDYGTRWEFEVQTTQFVHIPQGGICVLSSLSVLQDSAQTGQLP